MNHFLLIFILIIGSFLLFLALREFFCWYFKINENIRLLQEIERKLSVKKPVQKEVEHDGSTEHWKCPKCGKYNPNDIFECLNCGHKII
jgi:hypothetical protein